MNSQWSVKSASNQSLLGEGTKVILEPIQSVEDPNKCSGGKAIPSPFGYLHSDEVSTQGTMRCFRNSMACAFVFVDVDGCVSWKNEGYILHL